MNTETNQELPTKEYWNIGSSVLCRYMKKKEYLFSALEKRALCPRYVNEDQRYLGITEFESIAFPMICFCDIPFSKVNTHMNIYGPYGIAFDKNILIDKACVQPMHYINSKSPLADDFRTAFQTYYHSENSSQANEVLLDYLLSSLVYMKAISGEQIVEGEMKHLNFQDECEWRYIPKDFPKQKDIPRFLVDVDNSSRRREVLSNVLAEYHPETWLNYDWEDIEYIIVSDEIARKETIKVIMGLNIEADEKLSLVSKITISQSFIKDYR